MKLKLMVVLSVAAVALVIAGCSNSSPSSPKESAPASGQAVAYYACPMHPSIHSDKPGSCSICGMNLVPVYTNAPSAKP